MAKMTVMTISPSIVMMLMIVVVLTLALTGECKKCCRHVHDVQDDVVAGVVMRIVYVTHYYKDGDKDAAATVPLLLRRCFC